MRRKASGTRGENGESEHVIQGKSAAVIRSEGTTAASLNANTKEKYRAEGTIFAELDIAHI